MVEKIFGSGKGMWKLLYGVFSQPVPIDWKHQKWEKYFLEFPVDWKC